MSALSPVYSLNDARAAEKSHLANEDEPDALMKRAARAVADAALAMLPSKARILIVAGSGGNGGDGLFAGAHLALAGYTVHAVLTAQKAHEVALKTFRDAGGRVSLDADYDLVIDAVAGLGSSRGVDDETAGVINRGRKVLAIDSPTGVGTDNSVSADVTITFGQARVPHAQFPECGEVVIADIGLAEAFEQFQPAEFTSSEPSLGKAAWPENLRSLSTTGPIPNLIPGISDNKYTHGVTAIAAGSDQFPGAGIMCTAGALHTTTSMVVALGGSTHFPEVVPAKDVASVRRVDSWVVGPGRGTDDKALRELEEILDTGLPVVVDADAITLVANHDKLRTKLHGAVLTPHAGEFARLGGGQQELSDALGCHILLKGRITRITSPGLPAVSVNTGNSFAATAGSGDVLSEIIGSLLALPDKRKMQRKLLSAVAIHAHAAAIAASRPEGYAPITAMGIIDALGRSIGRLNARAF